MTVACAQCRWWEPIRSGLGVCTLASSNDLAPEHAQARAVAVPQTGEHAAGMLLTWQRFACTQFARKATAQGLNSPCTPTSGRAAAARSLVRVQGAAGPLEPSTMKPS